MVHGSTGLHHFHKRVRKHEKLEPYPHPNKFKRFMDKAIFVVGIFGPLMTIPQVMKVWLNKNVSGISPITWSAFIFIASFWLCYGILHKEKPIIITQSLWFTMHLSILAGVIIYG